MRWYAEGKSDAADTLNDFQSFERLTKIENKFALPPQRCAFLIYFLGYISKDEYRTEVNQAPLCGCRLMH